MNNPAPFQRSSAAPFARPETPGGWLPRCRAAIKDRKFLFVSVGLHALLIVVASVYIVQTVTAKRKLTFSSSPPSPNPSQRALEHRVQLAKKQNTMSAPAQAKRIVSTGLSKVSIPDMPAVTSTDFAPAKMAGMSGTGFGIGPLGLGAGSSGGGGGIPFFGLRTGNGLAGTFYDLKQTKEGTPTEMVLQPEEQGGKFFLDTPTNRTYDKILSGVTAGGMKDSLLGKYFRAPQTLYLNQLYIPSVPADEAPKAFGLGSAVKGRRWAVIYRGRVSPPESGRYRFAGFGDDILAVRLDNRVVLDASLAPPTKASQKERYPHADLPYGWTTVVGQTFEVTSSIWYPMEVLIGERPGGEFSAYLLLEKVGVENPKEPSGAPLLPIFKLAPGKTPERGKAVPRVAPDTSWSVWKTQSQAPLGGLR